MYKIGEFSKIMNIPIRTLRYYDEQNILKPRYIDKYTGYRLYDEENIIELELILILKSVNFTLSEISEYKDNLSSDILKEKQLEIKNTIFQLESKYEKINKMRENIQSSKTKGKVLTLNTKDNKNENERRKKNEEKFN